MPGFELFGDEEKQSVMDVLNTGVLFRYGFDAARKDIWKAKTFEKEFADYVHSKYCLLVSSGMAALSTALAACGVGCGDEVIIPPFTFVATVEGVITAGAVPVFGEIDDTLCLDPDKLDQCITKKTKAILPVHMCGSMAQIDRIKQFADTHGIMLIEDACQATGAHLNGKYAGTWGNAGCFSFDSVKTITCGEGGCVVTDDEKIYKRADAFHDHGHDHIGDDRGKEGHDILGLNFRISELNAAVGLAQLSKLNKILEIQKQNHAQIASVINEFSDIIPRRVPDAAGDSCSFINFMLPDENIARKIPSALASAGVDGSFYWYDNNWHYIRNWHHIKQMCTAMPVPQMHLDNMRDYTKLDLPQSDDIISRTISIPIKLAWTEAELEKRCENMYKVLKGIF
ncbi:MAG: DegT/DnrJ/EryC1/StrS family aminotransferase [Desulfovermiculus sp.]|nr:DegT/DnrJ/EryC1/StrS family aminotransferase [Desulfovermiculus sp.]